MESLYGEGSLGRFVQAADIQELLDLAEDSAFALLIETNSLFDAVRDDPVDNKFLEAAVDSEADVIISGDDHLKKLGEFQKIPILAPALFLERFRAGLR